MARTRKTTRKSTRPFGVPSHQLAPRHEGSSSGSNEPIGDLEAKVEQLRTELHHRNRVRAHNNQRIAELSADVRRKTSLLNGIWRLIGPSTHNRLLGTTKLKLELV
jgi:hypothetical protein